MKVTYAKLASNPRSLVISTHKLNRGSNSRLYTIFPVSDKIGTLTEVSLPMLLVATLSTGLQPQNSWNTWVR